MKQCIMAAMDKSIKTYSLPELASVMKELGQPAFRAQQLQEWLYQRHASSYDEMTNLPGSLRATLAERFPLTMPTVVDRQISKDGTRKYLVEFDDGIRVETVGIPSRNGDRLTVCFSTQVHRDAVLFAILYVDACNHAAVLALCDHITQQFYSSKW